MVSAWTDVVKTAAARNASAGRETFIILFPPDFARIVALSPSSSIENRLLQLTLWVTPVTSSHSIGPLRAKLTCSAAIARNLAGMFDLMPRIAR
jgi:hypothetical protein